MYVFNVRYFDIETRKIVCESIEIDSQFFETEKDGYCEGYTKNYTPVRVNSTETCKGKFLTVEIIEAEKDYCIGKFI